MLKKLTAAVLAAALCVPFFACTKADDGPSADEAQDEEPVTTYQIAVCRSYDSPVYDQIVNGFADALYDSVGEAQIIFNDHTFQSGENGEAVVLSMLSADNELVFSVGEAALSAAAAATTTTPIVGAGVIDYQDALHLLSKRGSWDRLTGRNVTGISAAPFIPSQLSLLIEATPELKTVGILYNPIDSNAIYQNEMLEDYLDEAGIPWKEYEIAVTEESVTDDMPEAADTIPTVILPTTVVAASGKEGPNIAVEDIGEEGTLTGINSPESTRTAKISKTWTGGKAEMAAAEEAASAADAANGSASAGTDASFDAPANPDDGGISFDAAVSGTDASTDTALSGASDDPSIYAAPAPAAEGLSPDESAEKIIRLACEECSVLYISAESKLTDRIDMIARLAGENGVSTIGGDLILGEKTLACMYSDPYDQGYRAGKVAVRILVDGEDASAIKIGQPKEDNLQKLYQDSVANSLGLSFPKSFSDIDEFLAAYVPGTNTKRVSKDK